MHIDILRVQYLDIFGIELSNNSLVFEVVFAEVPNGQDLCRYWCIVFCFLQRFRMDRTYVGIGVLFVCICVCNTCIHIYLFDNFT
jgi:hypothetical protein